MPVLMVLEDAHWIDPTSLDLHEPSWSNWCGTCPCCWVMTFRPEFSPPWAGQQHVTHAAAQPPRTGATGGGDGRWGSPDGKKLPAEVLGADRRKTDGVPLFVEELTKSVLESELLREEGDAYVLAAALTPLAIPSTLHDLLMARLDRLSPIKEIAQIGAAIGREFPHALLEAIAPVKGAALERRAAPVDGSGIDLPARHAAQASYVFKHALVQDAAYASLLRSRRQRIHAQIATALRERVTEEENAPAIIAHHFTEAGLAAPAASAWLAAAELALSQSAPVEAERHANAGLALLSGMSEGKRA